MQHVETLLAPVACGDVGKRERLRVSHVQVSGWVREHVEHVLAGSLVVWIERAELPQLVPDGQPFVLDATEVVSAVQVVGVVVLVCQRGIQCFGGGGHKENGNAAGLKEY